VVRPEPDRAAFFSPRRGYGQIGEALAAAATDAGARIETGRAVIAVEREREPGRAIVVRSDDGSEVEGANVWSTVPLPVLARLAGAPAPVLDAAAQLESRALVLVYVVLAQSRWTPYDAHYFPEPEVPMARVSEPKNYRTSTDDPTDVTVLCAEVPCDLDGDVWRAAPEELGAAVVDALRRSDLPTADPVHVEVRRVPRAYPVYRVGFDDAFGVVDRWATSVDGLLTFGRQGLFAHDNAHHALAMAWAAADAFSGGTIDAQAWSDARDGFRLHVVED
jgi:protoporphyrinogen oxidase